MGSSFRLKFAMMRLLQVGIRKMNHTVNHNIALHWKHLSAPTKYGTT